MNLRAGSRNVIRKSILLFASMAISAFAWGQHKTEPKSGPKPPTEHASKPVSPKPASSSNASSANVERTPVHAPAPSSASRPTAPRPTPTPRGNATAASGRFANARGNRAPEPVPVVDHIGDISEYRRGPAHPTPASPPASLGGGASAGARPYSPTRTSNGTLNGNLNPAVNRTGTINRNGMQIQHNPRGGRMVVSEHNGTRIVNTGAGNGYVQHAYLTRGGRSYYSRTYLDNGVYRVGVYRGYNYGGHEYYGYHPSYWYHPAFYNWAYRPWGAPVPWVAGVGGWGWAGKPWYGYYGGYFAPYPVYSSAAFWLTDYLIAADLQAAYAARAEANGDQAAAYDAGQGNADEASAANSGSPMLTPEIKQAIADEVKAELASEQQQSSGGPSGDSANGQSGDGRGEAGQAQDGQAQDAQASAPANNDLPSALDPARRTFVVPSNITVTSDGQECGLTPGDIITRVTNTPDADQNVTAVVSASKKKDCAVDKRVVVSLDVLQEMRNHFDEQLFSGIKLLADKQGTGGLPKAPDTATTASDVPVPAPDTTVAKDLNDQEAAADRAEMQMNQETAEQSGGAPVSAPQQQGTSQGSSLGTSQGTSQGSSQGTSLGDIARRWRAQKQAQAQSDSQATPAPAPGNAGPQN
jgi:hypothetical protein